MINQKFQNFSDKNIRIISLIQLILSSLVFLFFLHSLFFECANDSSGGCGLGFLIILPFYLIFLLVNIVITIMIISKKNKKYIIESIISILLITPIFWMPFFINLYDKYLKPVSSCEKIKNENKQKNCYNNLAVMRKDIGICDYIKDATGRDWCYSATAKNYDECLRIKDDVERKNECLTQFK